jgi:CRP/FNR family cyclic AMP-dependent transcriptional regulator
MVKGSLGREYEGGEVIVRQGDVGDCMYVVQDGEVEVVNITNGDIIRLAVLGPGDFFGEMAIFEKEVRSATVRALSKVRLLTIDRRTFLTRIQADPSLAFRIVRAMSGRIHQLIDELIMLKGRG